MNQDLINQFEESVSCKKENDLIMDLIIQKLGEVIGNSHTLPKWEVKEINEMLNRVNAIRKRIELIQNNLSKMMLDDFRE